MRIAKERILLTIERKAGVIVQVAKALRVDITTAYRWMNEDPDIKAAVAKARSNLHNLAESVIFEKLEKNDLTAALFVKSHMPCPEEPERRWTPTQNVNVDRSSSILESIDKMLSSPVDGGSKNATVDKTGS